MNRRREPRLVEMIYMSPEWSKLSEVLTHQQAFRAGVDYVCDILVGLVGHPVLCYPPSSVRTVSTSINRYRSHVKSSGSTGRASSLSFIQDFHAGAATALTNMELRAINSRLEREAKEIITCLEMLVHHEFVRLMELEVYGRRSDPYATRRMDELRTVRRMVGTIKLMR